MCNRTSLGANVKYTSQIEAVLLEFCGLKNWFDLEQIDLRANMVGGVCLVEVPKTRALRWWWLK